MMKIVDLAINDDYSILKTPNYYFYYGYEFDSREDEDEDKEYIMGFEVEKGNEKVFRISAEDMEKVIGCPKYGSCEDMLLFGIGLYLSKENNNENN